MTPYGYRIVHGEAVIDNKQALNLRTFFQLYLKGLTIDDAGHDAGILRSRTLLRNILSNTVYLGTDFYPRLITDEVFEAVQAERAKRKRTPENLDKRTMFPVMPASRFRLVTVPSPQGEMSAAALFSAVYDSIEPQREDYAADCFGEAVPLSAAKQIQELFTETILEKARQEEESA